MSDFGDRFDLREFNELMYEYRTAQAGDPAAVAAAFEAVKTFARSTPKQGEARYPPEITDEDVMALYLAWDEEPGTTHASLIRAAYARGVEAASPSVEPAPAPSLSQKMRAAGFTPRDTRIECDECGVKCTPQFLPLHACTTKEPKP